MATAQVITLNDFDSGRMKIPRTPWQAIDLHSYIDEQEEETLIRLLGLDLYVLFLADLDPQGVPQTARFLDIYNSFVLSDDCNNCRSRGMVHLLKGITFFHIQRDQPVKATTTGPKRKKGENSENMDMSSFDIFTRYNNSVDDYFCIRQKICNEIDLYPEFKGVELEYVINM